MDIYAAIPGFQCSSDAKHVLTLALESDEAFTLEGHAAIRIAEKLVDQFLLNRDGDGYRAADKAKIQELIADLKPSLTPDHHELCRFAEWLQSVGREEVFVLTLPSNYNAYFSTADPDRFARRVEDLIRQAESRGDPARQVFWGVNPFDASTNRKNAPKTENIQRLTTLIVDFDHPDKTGTHGTSKEAKAETLAALAAAAKDLSDAGWPTPTVLDSGNGGQNWYRIDLENNSESLKLLEDFLKAAARRYGPMVDTSTKTAAQNSRVPGTWNRSRSESPGYPNRRTRILSFGESAIVTSEQLQAFIDANPPAEQPAKPEQANALPSAKSPPSSPSSPAVPAEATPQEKPSSIVRGVPLGDIDPNVNTERPGDWFNKECDWGTILANYGWKEIEGKREGKVSYWCRPGKDHELGQHSATLGHCESEDGTPRFYVFTKSASPLKEKQGYTKFGFYAEMEHGGDLTAAAAELGRLRDEENERRSKTPTTPEAKTAPDSVAVASASPAGATTTAILQAATAPKPKRFNLIHSREFATMDFRPEWIIRGILSKGQPAVCAGGSKTLKTTLAIDAALAVGTGGMFLGEWQVPQKMPVAVFSGESGNFTIQETARRIAAAKNIDLADSEVFWDFMVPRFTHADDIKEIVEALAERNVGLAIVDPLYLALTAESKEKINTGNLYEVGPILLTFCRHLLKANVTPLILHHFKKGHSVSQNEEDTPELEDMSMAGIQEACRQWWLLKRRRRYEEGSGSHRLWFAFGGSIGFSGKKGLDIEEGTVDEYFGGRQWEVAVRNASEVREECGEEIGSKNYDKREKGKEYTVRKNAEKFMEAFAAIAETGPNPPGFATYTQIRNKAKISGDPARHAAEFVVAEGKLERFEHIPMLPSPRNPEKLTPRAPVEAYRRYDPFKPNGLGGTDGTDGTSALYPPVPRND